LYKSSLRSPETLVLYVLIVLSLVASFVGFKRRFSVEARNRRVETVVDYPDAVALSMAARQPLDVVLQRVKFAGITSLALTEDTVDNLRTDGAVTVVKTTPFETTFLCSPDEPQLMSRFEDALTHKTAITYVQSGNNLRVDASYEEISQLGLGLNPAEVSETIRNGLFICPRLYNVPGANGDTINWMLHSVKDQCGGKATTLIFAGLDVLGNRNSLHQTSEALATTQLNYGSVEFGKQIGDDVLCRLAADRTVRVHSIGGNEMPTMDIPTAIGRFGLAARERSIRVCYIRFFDEGAVGDPDVLKTNLQFIHSIRETLTAGGLAIGPAHPYNKNPLPGHLILILMSLGVAAEGVLLVKQFTGITGTPLWSLLAVSIVIGAFLATRSSSPIGREILALIAAMSFPTLGLLFIKLPVPGTTPLSKISALVAAVVQYCTISAVTFSGILLVVGLLADRLFMLKVYEFAGIRVAVFTPILLVALYYGLSLDSLPRGATWSDHRKAIAVQWNRVMSSPLLVGQLILGLVGLGIVGVILLRSGNDPGVGVSSTELGFRALLNKLLSVRPRTKEFLFGHPFLIFGLAAAHRGLRKPLPIFLLAGAIGQSSLLNTFCHIHTPLIISLMRAIIGLVLGGLIGSFAYLVLERYVKADEKPKLDLA
jgi:hypothetical protein